MDMSLILLVAMAFLTGVLMAGLFQAVTVVISRRRTRR